MKIMAIRILASLIFCACFALTDAMANEGSLSSNPSKSALIESAEPSATAPAGSEAGVVSSERGLRQGG
ncbi:MAG: hypothetical protein EBU49_13590, partial [Proteobacteria bacterium]|nr:hypothetical protein [Pseudomonadota bacterium]